MTASAVSNVFSLGAAECKISMEGLSTSEALSYMKALRAQVRRSKKQVLSAAWNLNQSWIDDIDDEVTDYILPLLRFLFLLLFLLSNNLFSLIVSILKTYVVKKGYRF